MKTIDETKGKRPTETQEFDFTVEYRTGERYVYHAKTKNECRGKLIKKMGSSKNIIQQEWRISEI